MIFNHTHEFHDDRLRDSTIDTQPTLSLETSQDEVLTDSEVPSLASASKVDNSSSETTGTDLVSAFFFLEFMFSLTELRLLGFGFRLLKIQRFAPEFC